MQRAALMERCAVRIQQTWKATVKERNVAWIRVINDDARRRHAARASFQLRAAGAADAKASPGLIFREAQEDILASVRKCFHGQRVVGEMLPGAQQHKRLRDAVHRRLGVLRAKTRTVGAFMALFSKARHEEESAESMWQMLATTLGTASVATAAGSHALAAASWKLAGLRSPTKSAKGGRRWGASQGLAMFRRQ